ncbi:uncharacterized protein LOC124935988 isoform X2 [Impatiens glandulifera]|uniref:uncharacterized protein LOC124935988 isoform X2 n=1 Tax=Impatiens glandulifera TaxID=253017 RepID=UPI001FB0B3E4|nr:uncharacterized protein LOC124935988 isoform X2 [Impatiens glandulifera]
MDADERLTALKKAYADIILNTAKEAAARILVSERKAFRYQHELNATKVQGLQMLLRLKQLSDSKASEAELMSLNQQKKIELLESQLQEAEDRIKKSEIRSLNQQKEVEELEAQLHEAEDIVKDLRDELKELEAELERGKNRKIQQLNEPDNYVLDTSKVNGISDDPQSAIISSLESAEQLIQYFPNETAVKPNLQPKLCTSDILPPPAEPPLEASFAAAADMNPSSIVRNEGVMNSCADKSSLPNIILKCKDPDAFRYRRTQRIRAFEEKLMSGQLGYNDPVNSINEELISLKKDKEGEGVRKTAIRKTSNNGTTQKKGVSSVKSTRRKRRRAKYRKTKTSLSIAGNNPDTEADCIDNNDLQFGEAPMNVAVALVSPNTTETGNDMEVVKAINSEKISNSGEVAIQELIQLKEVKGLTDNSPQVLPCDIDTKETDMPLKKPLETFGVDQTLANRIIKYTFQRKRKKDSMSSSSDGTASLEICSMKKREVEKQNDPVEMQMSSKTTESSGDSRLIDQVPCQLITLSVAVS